MTLKCQWCDYAHELPHDGTIKPEGMLAMPLHGRAAPHDPVETLASPDCCDGSEKLAPITEGEQ